MIWEKSIQNRLPHLEGYAKVIFLFKIHTRSQIAVESLQTVQIAFSNSADLSVMQKTEDSFLNASKMHCSLNNAEQRCLHMFGRQTLRKAFCCAQEILLNG